jgi:hypothetical protein
LNQDYLLHKSDADPKNWIRVKDVANLYCQKLRDLRRLWAESEILHPLGLDIPTFLANQSSMNHEFVQKIGARLIDYEFPTLLEFIFTGMDHDGPLGTGGQELNYPQLYVTENDRLSWLGTVGFAAIGIGKGHAESQFTFPGHWPIKPFPETLLLCYAAKKRAESAPGVGKATDVLVIGPVMGNTFKAEDRHVKEIDKIYRASRKSSERATEKARAEHDTRLQ